MTGIELFIKTLQHWGVPFISTLCGNGLNPLDEACHNNGLRLVDVRNEQAAAYMADAYGRLTGRPGVCSSSSGVAHVNALTGVLNAYFDGAPMLLVTGCGDTATMGLGHFQDVDQVALAEPICKYARLIDRVELVPEILFEAWSAAINGRPGPVHITFPQDMMLAEIDPAQPDQIPTPPERVVVAGDPLQITEAVKLLQEAQCPLIIAGSGVFYAHGESALLHLAREQAIPIVTPIWDRGSVSEPASVFMSVIGAATGEVSFLNEADVIIMAGAVPDYRVGYLHPPSIRSDARVIRIEPDATQLHRTGRGDLYICGDIRLSLESIANSCLASHRKPTSDWLENARMRQDTFRQECLTARDMAPGGMHALDIINSIQSVLTDETIVLIDGGNIGQWCHQALCDKYPGHWLTCGASGVVGYGLPAAMSARLLFPDRPIILITGDGALTFTIAEFESAARQNLGFAVVLADDEAWGITLTDHTKSFGLGITSELGPIQFDQVAQGFGAHGIRIQDVQELTPAISDAMNGEKPTLIHVPVVRSSPMDGRGQ